MIFGWRLKDMFAVTYALGSGIEKDSAGKWEIMRTLVIQMLDFIQVLRCITIPPYGWTPWSSRVTQLVDWVNVLIGVFEIVVPRYTWTGVLVVLVAIGIANFLNLMHKFKKGHFDAGWRCKAQNNLFTVLVSFLFPTVVGLMISPLECLWSDIKPSISVSLRGPGAGCTPFQYPEILITIPAVVSAIVFIFWSCSLMLLAFTLNPLSVKMGAFVTGRVELKFMYLKTLAVCLLYASPYITPISCNVILCGLSFYVLYHHLSVLPYHRYIINLIRGGTFMSMLWVSFGALVVSCLQQGMGKTDPAAIASDDMLQTLQWVILGCIPVAFVFGMYQVYATREGLYALLDRLYGECEVQKLMVDARGHPQGNIVKRLKGDDVEQILPKPVMLKLNKRSPYEKFYDVRWEGKRAFASSMHASTCARTLLYRRDENNNRFLNYIIKRGVEEHSYSDGLVLLHIKMLRFVFNSTVEAAAQEKSMQMSSKKLAMDDRYMLFALSKMAAAEGGARGGNMASIAVDLLEFDQGMDKARKLHIKCISNMKSFWRYPARKNFRPHSVEDMMQRLDDWSVSVRAAQKEYTFLLEKYTNSPNLLHAYASFCDTVLNDERQANEKRNEATANDKDEAMEDDKSGKEGGYAQSCGAGSAVSESESRRLTTMLKIKSIVPSVLGSEDAMLKRLHFRVQVFLSLLLILGTAAFVFAAYFIFNDVAVEDISGITITSLFRSQAVEVSYLQRSVQLAALRNDTDTINTLTSRMYQRDILSVSRRLTIARRCLDKVSLNMERANWDLYSTTSPGPIKEHFHNSGFQAYLPTGKVWVPDTFSYFTLVNDFSRRTKLGSRTTWQEMADPNYDLQYLTDQKRQIAYTQENIYRTLIEVFESIVMLYGKQVSDFGTLATNLVFVISCVIALNVVAIALFTLRALMRHIQTLQYKKVCIQVALTLPPGAARNIYRHFREIEWNMKSMEDEEMEKRALEDKEDPVKKKQDAEDEVPTAEIAGAGGYNRTQTAIVGGTQAVAAEEKAEDEEGSEGDDGEKKPPSLAIIQWIAASKEAAEAGDDWVAGGKGYGDGFRAPETTADTKILDLTEENVAEWIRIMSGSKSVEEEDETKKKKKKSNSSMSFDGNDAEAQGLAHEDREESQGEGSPPEKPSRTSSVLQASSAPSSPEHRRRLGISKDDDDEFVQELSAHFKHPGNSEEPWGNGPPMPPFQLGGTPMSDNRSHHVEMSTPAQNGQGGEEAPLPEMFSMSTVSEADGIVTLREISRTASQVSSGAEPSPHRTDHELVLGLMEPPKVQPNKSGWSQGREEGEESPIEARFAGAGLYSPVAGAGGRKPMRSAMKGSRASSPDVQMEGGQRLPMAPAGKIVFGGEEAREFEVGAGEDDEEVHQQVVTDAKQGGGGGGGEADELGALRELLQEVERTKQRLKTRGTDREVISTGPSVGVHGDVDLEDAVDPAEIRTKLQAQEPSEGYAPAGPPGPGAGERGIKAIGEDFFVDAGGESDGEEDDEDDEAEEEDGEGEGVAPLGAGGVLPESGDGEEEEESQEEEDEEEGDKDRAHQEEDAPDRLPHHAADSAEKHTSLLASPQLKLADGQGAESAEKEQTLPIENAALLKVVALLGSKKPSIDSKEDIGASSPAVAKKAQEQAGPAQARMITDETDAALAKSVKQRRSVYTSTMVYVSALSIILGLGIFCFLYPTRKVGDLVNIAATLNHASRRNYLVRTLCYLTREMVLNDGFSRRSKAETTSAIQFMVEELRKSDEAVRVGGSLGIKLGADDHNEEHNQVMYGLGCAWRGENATSCDIPGMKGLGGKGLYIISSTFVDSVRTVLALYGTPEKDRPVSWVGAAGDGTSYIYVSPSPDKVAQMQSDTNLAFIQQSFDGDLVQGLQYIVGLLQGETRDILATALNENKTLFSVHVVVVIVFFYFLLFRKTVLLGFAEVVKARDFCIKMPIYILEADHVEIFVDFFRTDEDRENNDKDQEEMAAGGEEVKQSLVSMVGQMPVAHV